jgi:hypothetical protein
MCGVDDMLSLRLASFMRLTLPDNHHRTPASSTPYAKMAYSHGRPVLRDKVEGVVDVVCQAPDALESTFGIEQEESEESDIDM